MTLVLVSRLANAQLVAVNLDSEEIVLDIYADDLTSWWLDENGVERTHSGHTAQTLRFLADSCDIAALDRLVRDSSALTIDIDLCEHGHDIRLIEARIRGGGTALHIN